MDVIVGFGITQKKKIVLWYLNSQFLRHTSTSYMYLLQSFKLAPSKVHVDTANFIRISMDAD